MGETRPRRRRRRSSHADERHDGPHDDTLIGAARTLLLALLVVAPLPFGSVHAWAFGAELILAAAGVALVAAAWLRGESLGRPPRLPALLLTAVAVAGLLQTVALPRGTVATVSAELVAAVDAVTVDDDALPAAASPLAGALAPAERLPISYAPSTSRREAAKPLLYAAVVLLAGATLRTRRDLRAFGTAVALSGGALATIGLVGQFLLLTQRYWLFPFPPAARPYGTFFNRNHFAGFVEMALPIALILTITALLDQRQGRLQRLLQIGLGGYASVALIVALIACQSRAGLVAATLAFVLLGWLLAGMRRVRVMSWVLVAVAIGLVIYLQLLDGGMAFRQLTKSGQGALARFESLAADIGYRTEVWRASVAMSRSHPLGVGHAAFALAYPPYHRFEEPRYSQHAESDPLNFLTEAGLPALALVIALLTWLGLRVRPGLSRRPRARQRRSGREIEHWLWFAAALAGVVGALAHGLVDVILHVTSNAILFCVLATIVGAAAHARPRLSAPGPKAAPVLLAVAVVALPALFLIGRAATADWFVQKGRRAGWSRHPAAIVEAAYARAARIAPDVARARYVLGRSASRRALATVEAETAEAEAHLAFEHLAAAVRLRPNDDHALANLGWFAAVWTLQARDPEQRSDADAEAALVEFGERLMQRAIALKPADPRHRLRFGHYLTMIAPGRLPDGLDLLSRTAADMPEVLPRILVLLEGRLPRFVVTRAVPDRPEQRLLYARHLDRIEECDEAMSQYRRALLLASADPASLDALRREIAIRIARLGHDGESLALWSAVLAERPRDPSALYGAALTLARLGLRTDARTLLDEALTIKTDVDAELRADITILLTRLEYLGGDCDRVLELTSNPRDRDTRWFRALCLEARGDFGQAHRLLTRLTLDNPADARAQRRLATLERKMARVVAGSGGS